MIDACGQLVSCGGCSGEKTCGGGGSPNVCGSPASCGPSLASPISTSPQLWLKADCLGLSDGAPVPAWGDARGSGIVATQPSLGAQPKYVSSSIGGLPAVRFAQAAQAFLSFAPAFADASYTLVAAGSTQSAQLTFLGLSTSTMGFGVDMQPLTPPPRYNTMMLFEFGSDIPWPLTGAQVYGGEVWASKLGGIIDVGQQGNQHARSTLAGSEHTIPTPFAYIGRYSLPDVGWRYSDGDIAEILVFATALSDSDRNSVEDYLLTKYRL
jgi:hypothetical protein